MSYGHAGEIIARDAELMRRARTAQPPPGEGKQATVTVAAGRRAEGKPNAPQPIDPATWDPPQMRAILAARDVGALYRALFDAGVSQHRIARLTGQSQSEVCEIIKGRRVLTYDTLARVADGLGIPRGRMGLASDAGPDAYPGDVTVADPFEGEDMLRRQFDQLLALAAVAAFGGAIPGVGELADLPVPPLPMDTPGRIGSGDVAMIRSCTDMLRSLARTCGGQAQSGVQLAEWAERRLGATATDSVRRELLAALSELHCTAAYCCHDVGAVARSRHHFARAVELATDAGDSYQVVHVLSYSADAFLDHDQANEALKLIQLAQFRLKSGLSADDPRVRATECRLHMQSASAFSLLGRSDQARSAITTARAEWEPPDAHARGDMDLFTALVWLRLGQLDAAEAAAKLSVQTFAQGNDRREGVVADVTLARLHVRAGEPRGLVLAEHAIRGVGETRSGLARDWLGLLAVDLEARNGREARELARMARGVAA